MSKVNPPPPDDEIQRRRQPQLVVDPNDVNQKDEIRAKQWATAIMLKNESKLNPNKFKNREIVTAGFIKPEDVDIKAVYPFPNLNWIIFRSDARNTIMWSIMLRSGGKTLFTTTFAKM